MIFIEPAEVFDARAVTPRQPDRLSYTVHPNRCSQGRMTRFTGPLSHEDGWDEVIHLHLLSRPGEPVRIMSLVSQLRRRVRHRDKAHKEELKRHILKRIGILIKTGVVVRVRRCFVAAPLNKL
jgi:hypothetical protein